MADLYKIQQCAVGPLEDLMKAIVAVNYHRVAADARGWIVDLAITEGGALQVQVTRSSWPAPDGEEAA